MSADQKIIILNFPEQHLEDFFYNTIGSKYCPVSQLPQDATSEQWLEAMDKCRPASDPRWDVAFEKINYAPQCWLGEVSWLKASMTDDSDTFIPSIVQMVTDIIGEDLPIINDELIQRISDAFDKCVNTTTYKVADKQEVIDFLNQYRGERVFTSAY